MFTDLIKLENSVAEILSIKRFEHTIAVKEKAISLAKIYGEDVEKAACAAILHDVTKELNFIKQLQIIENSDIMTDVITLKSPQILHAITGAVVAREQFGITDNDVLNAITYHTTARENMTLLEKIVYVADAVSSDREYKNVEKYRKKADKDIDKAFLQILKMTIKFLVKENTLIPFDTINAYNQQIIIMGEKNG